MNNAKTPPRGKAGRKATIASVFLSEVVITRVKRLSKADASSPKTPAGLWNLWFQILQPMAARLLGE